MIVITGAAGFIGSCLVSKLNEEGFYDIILVDDFSRKDKEANLQNKIYSRQVDRNRFFNWLRENHRLVQFIFHLGARTDTTETSAKIFDELNLNYSKQVWNQCCEYGIPLVYASSAATYGDGSLGYVDSELIVSKLRPLNPYGVSKNDFDQWVINQAEKPIFYAGFKFFNVYGPNEYHKGRMASVVLHAFNQIQQSGGMKLFKSHRNGIADGEQKRDFVYVKDLLDVLFYFMNHRERSNSGLYNLGSGRAESFLHLAKSVFNTLQKPDNIEFIDTPLDIRETYQYYTEADMSKLRNIGYDKPFLTLAEGIADYIPYLLDGKYY